MQDANQGRGPVNQTVPSAIAPHPTPTVNSELRYWAMEAEIRDGHVQPYGSDTVGIVDEEEGGVILYCHRGNEDRILSALRAV